MIHINVWYAKVTQKSQKTKYKIKIHITVTYIKRKTS